MKKLIVFLSLFLLTASPALAVKNLAQGMPSTVKARLTQVRLRSCQAREDVIEKQTSQLVKMTSNMLDVFDKIATRVKDHYTNTVVPSGKTVSNYSSLVADIAAKKAAVSAALTAAQTGVDSFSCDGDNPKGVLSDFHTDMRSVKSALKDYRAAINKLIVAVRTVQATPTPTP